MIKRGALLTWILILLFAFSTLLPSPSLSCQTSIKYSKGSLVCLLPDNSIRKVKPVMALVTKDGEFYPLMDSEDLTHKLDINEKKIYESRH